MPLSTKTQPQTYAVATRAGFGDAWTDQTELDVLTVDFGVAPRQSTATLRLHYGVKMEGSTKTVVPALDLRGQLIRIILTDSAGNAREWYGYCPRPNDQVDGTFTDPFDGVTARPSGTTTFICYGLDYFLRQHLVDRSVTTAGVVRRAQPFNRRATPRGTRTIGLRAASKTASTISGMPDYYQFDPDGTATWTALDAVEHLLEVFARVYGVTYLLGGQYASLANVKGSWNLDGTTFFDAINALINPATGFAWYIDNTVLQVVTTTDVALAGGLIPANSTVVNLTLDQYGGFSAPTVAHVESSHYDEIEVRGEPVRVCFTMSYQYSSADQGWTSAEATAYDALSEPANDADAQEHLYSRLQLPDAWNQETNGNNVMPVVDETDGSLDVASKQPYFEPSLVLDRNLPLLDDRGHPRRPIVVVNDGGTYRRVDKPGESKPAAAVRVLDDAVGIQLDGRYPHQFGNGHYGGSDTREATFDWQHVYATVGMALPDRVRIVKTPGGEPGPVTKRKIITVPDAHLWYVVPGTITDATGATPTTHAGGYERDDRAELQRIADLAESWYGRRRAVIDLPYLEDIQVPRLGQVIKDTYTGGSVVPTGTLITVESYNLQSRTTRIQTEYFDLDVAKVAGSARPASAIHTANRILRVEEQLPNIPVRPAVTEQPAEADEDTGDSCYCVKNIAIFYADNASGDAYCKRSADFFGSNWNASSGAFEAEIDDSRAGRYIYPVILDNGFPACCYSDTGTGLYFLMAENGLATDWDKDNVVTIDSAAITHNTMRIVDGYPAVAYIKDNSGNKSVYFCRATAIDGSAWDTPILISGGDHDNTTSSVARVSLEIVDGQPAVCFGSGGSPNNDVYYCRASNAQGSTWPAATKILTGSFATDDYYYPTMAVVNGRPAVAYVRDNPTAGDGIWYLRASDAQGTSWAGTQVQVKSGSWFNFTDLTLRYIGSRPQIIYNQSATRFIRGTDKSGSSWTGDTLVNSTAYSHFSKINDLPVVVINAGSSGSAISVARGTDAKGASWATAGTGESIGGAQYYPTAIGI